MINIAHPKVSTKPPISKCTAERRNSKNADMYEEEAASEFISKLRESNASRSSRDKPSRESDVDTAGLDSIMKSIGFDVDKLETTNDCNQNVIEPDSYSFKRLCSMINDLEGNISSRDDVFKDDTNGSVDLQQKYLCQVEPEKDSSKKTCHSTGSTYEDIMSFLEVLEQDEYSKDSNNGKSDAFSSDIIQELFTSNQCHSCCNYYRSEPNATHIPNTLKDELATANLQLEERDATVRLLKSELKSERQSACEKLESQRKQHAAVLQQQKTKYQGAVKRHQKFIEQLLSEKKDLTEKCNALAERIKEMDAKQQRETRVANERHAVELQRARELCAASEKIRRERWLEAKTSKIKEMTVKGLEPELHSMIEQHQQEIQKIRATHMRELQDVELRAIRRSNQQLEQLRIELTASHEKTLANEREALRARYQEKLEEQEVLLQAQQRRLLDELQQERRVLAEEQRRKDAERTAAEQHACSQFNEKVDTLNRQYAIERKAFQESLRVEQETWMENYGRQQNAKLQKIEDKVRLECNRERDRQIELAIERLEKETRDMKANLQQSSEGKLRCLKEKYEAELLDANESQRSLKAKLTTIQAALKDTESRLETSESKLQRCTSDLNNFNQLVEKLTMEKDNAKKVVRQEIESEKRELEDKIASLYRELTENNSTRDALMAQLYSRIKLIVTQKDLAIKNLTRELDDMKGKCDHLDKLLDQQRKDYILKSL